ncbi:hypothetical protein [Planktotalea sp.]|uniref:hypothetical protein n=1 Tax=Planktotalea sp. TaxID=2029877 RepID=UPI003299C457
MLLIFVSTLYAALVVSNALYLQLDAPRWKGPLVAIVLFLIGMIIIKFSWRSLFFDLSSALVPFRIVAIFCSIFIGIGIAIALIFGNRVRHLQLIKTAFAGTWGISFTLLVLMVLAF